MSIYAPFFIQSYTDPYHGMRPELIAVEGVFVAGVRVLGPNYSVK